MSLDALVLLGCRIGPHCQLSGAARRRAARAADAWREGAAPMIVASGGRLWHGVAEADALRAFLLGQGVPEGCVLAERRSQSTRQNAHFCAELLRAWGATEVGVVTCDWHLPRALQAFNQAGLRATGIAAPSPPVGRSRRLVRGGSEQLSSIWDRALARLQCRR